VTEGGSQGGRAMKLRLGGTALLGNMKSSHGHGSNWLRRVEVLISRREGGCLLANFHVFTYL
jgi:hypothetical protein